MGGAIADAVLQGQQPGACAVLLGQQCSDRVCLFGGAAEHTRVSAFIL